MASALWKISLSGGPTAVTLDSLGIVAPRLELASLDVSTLTFTVRVASINTACAFTYGQTVVLSRGTAIWFVGRVRGVVAAFAGGAQAWAITVCDTWWEFERTVYRQSGAFYGSGTISGFSTSLVTLGRDAWGRGITLDAQIADALGIATAETPGLFTTIGLSAMSRFPLEETREITIAEALRRAASLQPKFGGGMSYTTGIAAINILARGDMPVVTLDLDAADTIVEGTVRARPDLVPPGVAFYFRQPVTDGDGKLRNQLTKQTAGSPNGVGAIHATFELGEGETVPTGCATAYYESVNDLHHEGSIELLERECTGVARPGQVLNLTNGPTAWATMRAQIQRVQYDLDEGITTINVGPPEVLGADEFVDALNRLRNRPARNGWSDVQHNGTEGYGDEGPGGAPDVAEGDRTGNDKAAAAPAQAAAQQVIIDAILTSLHGAVASLLCLEGGGGTITFTFPDLPPAPAEEDEEPPPP